MGRKAGLGSGYVSMVYGLLGPLCPDTRLTILNTGIGGNRVLDLEARWQADVIDLAPDWLSVLIGINDVWRHFDNAERSDHVSPQCFQETYRRILDRVRPGLKGLVLMTPYFIEPNRDDPMRVKMDEYGALVGDIANDYDAVCVDLQAAFNRYLAHNPSQMLCGDRIHPNAMGHMIIATAFLTSLGAAWDGLGAHKAEN